MVLHCSSILLIALFALSRFPMPCCANVDEQAVGGQPIREGQYRWFSAIFKGYTEADFLCSGALIGRRHVITADHCLRDNFFLKLYVRIGYLCPRPDNCGQTFQIREIMEHRRDTSLGDVAILVLSSRVPSEYVPAIPDIGLPSVLSSVNEGTDMLLVGAGRDGTSNKLAKQAETLQIQLKHKSYKKCRKDISDKEVRKRVTSEATICSISDQGKPCQGDSGSAIVVDGGGSVGNVIVAVHNYGPRDCSGADDDDIFGHVAVSAVANFVVSVVCHGNNEENKENWCPPLQPPSSRPESPQNICSCTEEDAGALDKDSLQVTLRHDLASGSVVRFVAFDATSSLLASAQDNYKVKLRELSPGGPSTVASLRVPSPNPPESLAFNPTGTKLAVDYLKDVALFDVVANTVRNSDRKKLRMLRTRHTENTSSVAWHPDGNLLASGSHNHTITLLEADRGFVRHTFQGQNGSVVSVSFDPRGRFLASASIDTTIRIWDLSTLSHVRSLEEHTDDVRSVTYSPDGTRLASGSYDQTIRIWRSDDGLQVGVFSVGSAVRSVAWSSDSQFLVSGSQDGLVRVWDATQSEGPPLLELEGHSVRVNAVAWSPNAKWIASGSLDRTLKVWEVSSS